MKRYPAPPPQSESNTPGPLGDFVSEAAGKAAGWTADFAAAEPGIAALLGTVALILLWRIARPVGTRKRRIPRPISRGGERAAEPAPAPPFLTGAAPPLPCRWKRDKRRHRRTRFTRWVCAECGAEGYSSDGKRPTACKRHLRAHQL